MKKRVNISKAIFITFVTVMAAIMAGIALAMVNLRPQRNIAHAEGAGSITVHVYDPAEQYSALAAWVWIGGAGREVQLTQTPAANEPYKLDGGSNVARRLEITLSEKEVEALKKGTELGMLICKSTGSSTGDFWARYVKETEDVKTSLKTAFDDKNHVELYYVRKDTVANLDFTEAKLALEKINSARFTGKDASGVTVAFDATSPLKNGANVRIDLKGKTIATSTLETDKSSKLSATARFKQITAATFDFTANYQLYVDGIKMPAPISKATLIDDVDFINMFESEYTQNAKLGAEYTKQKTTFRVWAPFATKVRLNLYSSGEKGTEATDSVLMDKDLDSKGNWSGIWKKEMAGDLNGTYYTYTVDNYGQETETIDMYAKACGTNGDRGMVIDLDSTDPVGWDKDKHLYASETYPDNADVPIIWEIHVKDFSASPDSGMVNKGKYLAFTEKGTTVPGEPTLRTGVNYLKNTLGITYVHLNPVYDFVTVDEKDTSSLTNKDAFNWGYDPLNYNIPEGSYSTDPSDGKVRIKEFKQMVMALHEAGIGVIMDVVYNHTASMGGQAFHDTVPYYYHRTTASGEATNGSGCGNETASERTMMRKFMVESLLYWADEYHIDGFRFDLMGLHDKVTMNTIRQELDNYDGGKGRKILLYGEPWTGDGGDYIPASFTSRVNNTKTNTTGKYTNNADNARVRDLYGNGGTGLSKLSERVAVFGDTGRDGLRGNNDPGSGWGQGGTSANSSNTKKVMKMMLGGSTGGEGLSTRAPSQLVCYASAHDNYTLWDQLMGKQGGKETPLYYAEPIPSNISKCEVIATAYMMSAGIPFMLAGEEMGRTKCGNHNSYNSPAKLNQIVWSRQKEFAGMVEYYAKLIDARKKCKAMFSYSASTSINNLKADCTGSDDSMGYIKYNRSVNGINLVCTLNPNTGKASVTITGSVKININN